MAKAVAKTTPSKSVPKNLRKTTTKTPVQKQAVAKTSTRSSTKATAKPSTSPTTSSTPVQPFTIRKSYVAVGIVIVLIGLTIYLLRGLFVAAVVNGQPISRLRVVQEAEKQSGKQSLNTLVRNTLIGQEAQKQHVTVGDDEVNAEVKKTQDNLKKQGQNIDQVLAMNGMTMDDLKQLIRLDKLVQKMVGKNIKVTDQQVNDYIDKNKDTLPTGQNEAQLKTTVKNQLYQQQLNTKVQAWLTDLQSKAHILYFVQY